ncbi:hypothetical protein [Mycobacterium sp.]|uniref:hypothetical protein n=1 Tax=Mycobacterium sp. TaxID=1785 RepID=UPI003D0C00E0
MADVSGRLHVLPAALRSASGVIASHAAKVALPPSALTSSTEASGMAAAAVQAAFAGFGNALSNRLSSVATDLTAATGAFTDIDAAGSAELASIAPQGAG